MVEKLLEEEFAEYAALHKYSVVFAMAKKYYIDLQETGVNIPDFMRDDSPDELARRDLIKLITAPDGGKEFNRLYELAWEEVAPLLD